MNYVEQPVAAPVPVPSEPRAVVSLVLGILGIVLCPILYVLFVIVFFVFIGWAIGDFESTTSEPQPR